MPEPAKSACPVRVGYFGSYRCENRLGMAVNGPHSWGCPPLSASVGIAKPMGIKAISEATATACEKGSTPNTARLNDACPAKKCAVPSSVSAQRMGVAHAR